MENVKLCERFILKKRLGGGSFGEIYLSEDTQTKRKVAVKLENSRILIPQLELEAKIYRYLSTNVNLNLNSSTISINSQANSTNYTYMNQNVEIPSFYYYGADLNHNFNVLAIDVLGRSLEDLLDDNDNPFSLKTVLMIADQMISCVEFVHKHGYIHRDIKPDNFMVSLKSSVCNPKGFLATRYANEENIFKKKNYSNKINIIDFGLSKRYRDAKTGEHIQFKKKKTMTGTARYASLAAMIGSEQSRRDDMESLGYVFVYLLKGRLPWQGLPAEDHKERLRKIYEKKKKTPIDDLCKGLPQEFATYLKKVRKLKFEEEPDYSDYRQLFRDLLINSGFVYDYRYDWNEPKEDPQPVPISCSTTKIIVNNDNYKNLPKVTPNIQSNLKDANNNNNVNNTKTVTINPTQIPNHNQNQPQQQTPNANIVHPVKQPNEPPPIRISNRRSRRARSKRNNRNNENNNNLVQSNVNLNASHPINFAPASNAANMATTIVPSNSQPLQQLHSHVQPPRRVNNWAISPRRDNIKLSSTAGPAQRIINTNTNSNVFNNSTPNANQPQLNLASVLPKINKYQVQ